MERRLVMTTGLASQLACSVGYSGCASAAQREDEQRDGDIGDERGHARTVHWDLGLQLTVIVAIGRYKKCHEDIGTGQLGVEAYADGHLDGASVRDGDRRDVRGTGQLGADAYDSGHLDGTSV
jgi:hypothetical protein